MSEYEESFGHKNLNNVTIRAYSDLVIGNKQYKAGEPIFYLDKVQMAQLNENKKFVAARGGWKNLPQVIWTDFFDLHFQFVNGLLSKTSLGFFTESGAIYHGNSEAPIKINKKEEVDVVNGKVRLLHNPLNERLFIYIIDEDGYKGQRIEDYEILGNTILLTGADRVLVDYYYEYKKEYVEYKVTDREMEGYVSIEGYMDVKSEETGLLQTYFFEIPKAKITSNLDMKMGEKANPTLSVFEAIGLPIERNGEKLICSMILLEEDVMSDF